MKVIVVINKKEIEKYGPEWIILELIAKGNEEGSSCMRSRSKFASA